MRYNDGTYPIMVGARPLSIGTTLSVHTGTTPDEIALRLRFPVEVALGGYEWTLNPNTVGRDFDIVLYDNNDAVIETHSYDLDQAFVNAARYGRLFSSDRVIPANTTYRLALKPTTASGVTVFYIEVNDAAHWGHHPGGELVYWSERTDGGAWTDRTIRRPEASVLISQIHDGAGGGGMRLAGHGGLAG